MIINNDRLGIFALITIIAFAVVSVYLFYGHKGLRNNAIPTEAPSPQNFVVQQD